jgi:DEAD/DEAH box helicase domain-containing protein
MSGIGDYIEALKNYEALSPFIVCHKELPGKEAEYGDPSRPFSPEVVRLLERLGLPRLYRHQIQAIDSIRNGVHTVVATPTASGKTMIYTLPVIEKILEDPESRALYLFPLKALAQDQLKSLKGMFDLLETRPKPTADVYDGDTPSHRRTKMRKNPPQVVLSNPEMLHLAILPFHDRWAEFLGKLKYVVVDEVHTMRGVMGSHMAWVFRRLLRICSVYGANPVFIFCSATIGNPGKLASELTGLPVEKITESTAARNSKHFLMLNTPDGAAQAAIALLHAALHRNLRTIIYSQSRKMTELIALWASRRAGKFKDRISAYRAGFLPEERRDIEAKLTDGSLLAVVTTSALELGIDIGSLDLCILVGYPGTMMATWQRAGRVGRSGRESAVIFIAHEDALDQYMMKHPEEFFSMEPECAVVNPMNPVIMKRHIVCAAADLPIDASEPWVKQEGLMEAIADLESYGGLLRSEDGDLLFSPGKYPQRKVALRGTGENMDIVDRDTGEIIGSLDRFRAFHEAYPGAVYLHRGEHYLISDLDLTKNTAVAVRQKVHYFTRARSSKTTEILETFERKNLFSTRISFCRLKVTETVTGYEKKLIKGQRLLGVFPLELPPMVFETEGIVIEIPESVRVVLEKNQSHFMGGIHAMEHAVIGILPLLVMTDRNDLGGISIPYHPQVGTGAVFVYDGFPGGVGLAARAFEKAPELFDKTFEAIRSCTCETGCPACVHSPKCGSGNRPIDKQAALHILNLIREGGTMDDTPVAREEPAMPDRVSDSLRIASAKSAIRYGVLDLETRRSAEEVGGWGFASRMGVSCVVVYDSETDRYEEYLGEDIEKLTAHLKQLDLVVGFNIVRFDYAVLKGYSAFDFHSLPTLDILAEIHQRLGYRLSLDHLGEHTLGAKKSADGLMALKWWKEGKIREIIDYCRDDVRLTRDLYRFGQANGYLLFKNKAGMKVRVPVDWP